MKIIYNILAMAVAVTLYGCEKSFGDYQLQEAADIHPTMSIADVRALYRGEPMNVTLDVVIAGYVTANDRGGNFHRSFIIEDDGAAIEVRAGTYSLWNDYPFGKYVAVKARGLTVGAYNGVLEIGKRPVATSGSYQTSYFGNRAELEKYVFAGESYGSASLTTSIPLLHDNMCGRVVRLGGLTFDPDTELSDAVTWAEMPELEGGSPATGYRIFSDGWGGEICVVTSAYAAFAREEVPRGPVVIQGILSRGRSGTGRTMWLLKMRDSYDVQNL